MQTEQTPTHSPTYTVAKTPLDISLVSFFFDSFQNERLRLFPVVYKTIEPTVYLSVDMKREPPPHSPLFLSCKFPSQSVRLFLSGEKCFGTALQAWLSVSLGKKIVPYFNGKLKIIHAVCSCYATRTEAIVDARKDRELGTWQVADRTRGLLSVRLGVFWLVASASVTQQYYYACVSAPFWFSSFVCARSKISIPS